MPGFQSVVALSVVLSCALACENDPGRGKPSAKVGKEVPVPEQLTTTQVGAATAASKYVFSNAGSRLGFVGAKITRKHEGAFNVFSGAIELVEGDLAKSLIMLEIAMASLTADDPKLTAHLKSPDFFDVEKFPKASFRSTRLEAGGEGGATHTVTGNLTVHGTTKSIRFPAWLKLAKAGLDVRTEFVVDRRDFGVVYPGMKDDLIKDEVLLRATIHATQMPK